MALGNKTYNMTQKEKDILLKDLCARLPYKVKGQAVSNGEIYRISSIISVSPSGEALLMLDDNNIDFVTLEQTKPYLRPMSSMTEEEREEYDEWHLELESGRIKDWKNADYIDWLNSHHFDYRGLIPKGLALEAPEDMYKIE